MISFKQIKATVSIELVLSHYALFDHLVEKGESYRGTCPFCDEQENLPFSVSLEKNCFNAFCCGEHGNILDFVAQLENVSIKRAAKIILEFTSIEVKKEPVKKAKFLSPKLKSIETQVSKINTPLEFTLKSIDPTHIFVTELGLSVETVKSFGAGFYTGRGMYKDHFVIPIYSFAGDLVAYTGISREEPAKAIYPPTFNRESELFARYQLCNPVQSNNPLIVCHDPLQILMFAQAGYESLAFMNDIISDEQIKLLCQYSELDSKIILFLPEENSNIIENLTRLINSFYVRLVQYQPDLDIPTNFHVDDINDFLVP